MGPDCSEGKCMGSSGTPSVVAQVWKCLQDTKGTKKGSWREDERCTMMPQQECAGL